MKTALITKMMVFGFALTISLMLGLSSAGAIIEPPCINLLVCKCDDALMCPDPFSEISCTLTIENCGTERFLDTDYLYVGDSGQGGGVYVYPGTPATITMAFHKTMPGDYTYDWTVTATDDAGNTTTTDGCSGIVSVPPCPIEVPVDIKPMSCPNPLNVKDRGVLPVAIPGASFFDVTQIDPASIMLEGVSPLRWSYDDIATFELGSEDCNDYGADGYLDLVLMFDTQEVITALGPVADGDVLVLTLSGNAVDEYNTPITGQDVVVILKKGK